MNITYGKTATAGCTPPPIEQELEYVYDRDAHAAIRLTSFDDAFVFSAVCHQARETRLPNRQEQPYVHLFFSLEGTSAAQAKDSYWRNELSGRQHTVQFTPFFEGDYVLNGPRVRSFGVRLPSSFFERLMNSDLECVKRFWDKVQKGETALMSPYPLPITPRQSAVINDMQHCSYTGHTKLLYYESKIVELFLLQAIQAESLAGQPPLPLSRRDTDKLYAARHFVQQHMLKPITLAQVARASGLNDFKLKRGFRMLFGTTVFGYLNDLRMNYARELLLDTSCTVYEAAYKLGYTEPHGFSKAFKKYFGYLPGSLKG